MDERKHLTGLEVDRLRATVKEARHKARDRCLVLLLSRHGLRVSEACGMKLSQVDSESRGLHVARLLISWSIYCWCGACHPIMPTSASGW
jgi:type 1 fimbriae regulatory protein FimB